MTHQNDLFEAMQFDALEAENAPVLDLEIDLIAVVNRAIGNMSLSRDQVVDRINLCLRGTGKKTTKVQLNKWLSPSQQNAIPGWVLPAICWAVQSDAPFKVLLHQIGRKVVDVRGDHLREMTEKKLLAAAHLKEIKDLEKQMTSMFMTDKGL